MRTLDFALFFCESKIVHFIGGTMKKVAVMTYPVKHRKTYDVLSLLKANGYDDVLVCAIPFHYEKKKFPRYQHRPEMNYSIPDLNIVCDNLGYKYVTGNIETFDIEDDRIVLVGGAGILQDSFIKNHTVINAHPGYIPDCRGLDSFKWAIVENKPIGVTSHIIGDYVDAGQVIERRKIEVYISDTFHSLAQRVYENEVSMLVEAVKKYNPESLVMMEPGDSELHKRMPADIEEHLLDSFEAYKQKHAVIMEERRQ